MITIDVLATGYNIKNKCKEKNLTPKDLSEQLGITSTAPYYWFEGKSLPRLEVMLSLCKVLECSVEDLMAYTNVQE